MNKRTNNEMFLAKIVIAIALVAILGTVLWGYFGQDTIAVKSAKEAYSFYMIENPGATDKDFIYIYEDTVIVAIRDGKVVRKEYATEADAVMAALGSKDGANYSLAGTDNGKLFVVKLFEKTDDIYALGSATLATGADKLTVKVVSDGMIFATFDIPAEAIDRKQSPVGIAIKVIDPEDNVKLGKNEKGFAYDIDVTNLVENNTARIAVTMNGPKGLVAGAKKTAITVYHKDKNILSTYDPTTGKISFETANFSPFTFTYEVIEVSNLADLRYYLLQPGRANIKLTAEITIDMESNRVEEVQGIYGGDKLYFGALVFGEKSLDLNGCNITYTGKGANDSALFAVGDNASFTIRDSKETGIIAIKHDQYAVWAVNDSSTVNILSGIFMADEFASAAPDPNRALVYSSGGEIHVRGGYFLYENTKNDKTNGGFNVLDEITVPRIWIYEGVSLSNDKFRQVSGNDDDSIMLIGGATCSTSATAGKTVTTFKTVTVGEGDNQKEEIVTVNQWYKISGQALQIKSGLNTDKYIYRVGNGNSFSLDKFFAVKNSANVPENISVRAVNIVKTREDIEAAKDAANAYDKTKGYYGTIADKTTYITLGNVSGLDTTVQLSSFTGPVRLELYNSSTGALYAAINLEVVDGVNATSATNVTDSNVCLLNNISATSISVKGGYTLYGNGFTITDARTTTTNDTGLVSMVSGTLDNVNIDGYQSGNGEVTYGNNGYSPIISIADSSAVANIYNSYIQGGRQAIFATNANTIYLKNTTLDGGSRANMEIVGGNVTLENCTTTTDTTGGAKGLSILVASASVHVTLEGTFTQHNWLTTSDLAATYRTMLSSFYKDPYQYDSRLNMGILFLVEKNTIDVAQVQKQLTDNTANKPATQSTDYVNGPYGYITKEVSGTTATFYLPLGTVLGAATATAPTYQSLGNHPVVPESKFDHTDPAKNYQEKTTGSDVYCYYDGSYVNISFEFNGSKVYKTDILTATKYGKTLDYVVYRKAGTGEQADITIDGEGYVEVGDTYTFSAAGEYSLYYVCTDPYNYTEDLTNYTVQYVKELKFKVKVAEKELIPTDFQYVGDFAGYGDTTVIANNMTYVMPNVSADVSGKIGHTTVDGKTIYYPIVNVHIGNSSAGSYKSSGGYFWSPAFNAINITDYNQDTGAVKYKYDTAMKKWPHDIATTTGVKQGTYYGYIGDNSPWTYDGTAASAFAFKHNTTYGLSFVASNITTSKDPMDRLVEFYYIGTDGVEYRYFIMYRRGTFTHKKPSICITADTLVTLADGTQKRIDELSYDDQILAWDFKEGKYVSTGITIVVNHGYDYNDVIRLTFDDGTMIKAVNGHGFFRAGTNEWVIVNADNVNDFINSEFVLMDGNTYKTAKLIDAVVTTEYVEAWGLVADNYRNCISNGLFSITPTLPFGAQQTIYTVGEGMKYDSEMMQADIDKYGLYTYEEFAHLLTREEFEAFNVAEFKIMVGKGYCTYDDVIDNIIGFKYYQSNP